MNGHETLVIREARILGDTGAARLADVEIREGRIVGVRAAGAGRGRTLLQADGLLLTPGFIDIHGHSDMALAHPDAPGLLEPFLLQGITTQVIGNCGLGVAPIAPEHAAELRAFMALILPRGVEPRWRSFAEYLAAIERPAPPFNVVALAPHGALRCAAHGARPGPLRGADLERVRARLREALDAGAFGLSAGLIYPPGMWADTEELVELCRDVATVDGLFACHVRGSSELAVDAQRELLEIGRRTRVRLQHSHHEAFGPDYWHLARETLRLERAARAGGLDVASDVIPYHAVNTTLLAIFPPWALEGGVSRLCERLAGPEAADIERAIAETVPAWPPWEGGWAHNLVRAGGWDNIVLLHTGDDRFRDWIGHDLAAIADRTGTTPFACASRVVRASGGDVMARYHAISGAPGQDAVLRELLADPAHAVGVDVILKGEGISHPGGHGALPRLLGAYARDHGWMDLATAIAKLTSVPADRLGLADRGRLAPGFAADLVLFDPGAIGERGSWSQPDRPPAGIRAVLVNGTIAVDDGRVVEGRAGHVLRRAGTVRNR